MSIRAARWLAGLFVILTAQAFAADRPWRMAVTPHYRLLSQLNDRDSDEWMRDFDQFILSTSDVLQMDLRALPPLTVVIYDSDKRYTPYKLDRPNGDNSNIAGQFVRRPTWSMIGMGHRKDNAELQRIIQHEATHWLMSADQARQPAWFTEGIAEMFSTFERRGEKVNWAKPIGLHLGLLREGGMMPLSQLLVEPGALFDRDERTTMFYAQAWAFTHFLMMSKDPARRQLLFKFLQNYRMQSGEAAVTATFGASMKEIEHDFHLYIDQKSFIYMAQPVKPAANPPALQPAPPAIVEASLGLLALSSNNSELAKKHADKAIALDANAAETYTLLAYMALAKRDFAEATKHAEAALQHGSKDSEMYVLMGDSYANGPNADRPDANQARVNLYENAVNLSPRRLGIYERLTQALLSIDKPREEDAKFLSVGLRAFPGEDWLRVGTAAIDYKLGRREQAMTTLDKVLRPESTLDGQQRYVASNLRRNWLMEEMNTEVKAATEKKDFAAARATISRYRERLGDDDGTLVYLKDLDSDLELRDLLSRYDAALRARKKADIKALAEQMLARPNVPADLRRYLQQTAGG
jgi:tetratricopeptide (TPR) repeat protein